MSVLVGRPAPDFTAPAVLGDGSIVNDFNLSESIKNQYGVIFFYPLDFTLVCPTELIAFDHRFQEFEHRNAVVIGISIDSQHSHRAWRNTPIDQGGIGPVHYPLVADIKHDIIKAYGVEKEDQGIAYRGSFLIDQSGIVRHQVVNDNQLGRNVDEMLRTLDALTFHEQHGEVCPAGWQQGDPAIQRSPEGIAKYLSNYSEKL